mmetsp:Transcript_74931/g.150660  ORF Transcript_74931/g.150660 Transcript_74931/m.150660 type:complete len:212 (-) Transcript_74931:644-1279(-)
MTAVKRNRRRRKSTRRKKSITGLNPGTKKTENTAARNVIKSKSGKIPNLKRKLSTNRMKRARKGVAPRNGNHLGEIDQGPVIAAATLAAAALTVLAAIARSMIEVVIAGTTGIAGTMDTTAATIVVMTTITAEGKEEGVATTIANSTVVVVADQTEGSRPQLLRREKSPLTRRRKRKQTSRKSFGMAFSGWSEPLRQLQQKRWRVRRGKRT